MIENLGWSFAFNLIVNAVLSFFTVALLIYLLIIVCRIKWGRCLSLLLFIPLLKLIIDPFLYDFQQWALAHQLNPLEAESGSRMISAWLCYLDPDLGMRWFIIQMSLISGETFTLADLLSCSFASSIIKRIVCVVGVISLLQLGNYLFQLVNSSRIVTCIRQNAMPCERLIHNEQLLQKIESERVELIQSKTVDMPCAFGVFHRQICIPVHLMALLTQEEFEAVVAHELNHLCWYDSVRRIICHGVCALFWWIPTKWLLCRIERAQEIACDANMHKFNINEWELASAIVKVVNTTRCPPPSLLLTSFIEESSLSKRLQLLCDEQRQATQWRWLQMGVVIPVAGLILWAKCWIF